MASYQGVPNRTSNAVPGHAMQGDRDDSPPVIDNRRPITSTSQPEVAQKHRKAPTHGRRDPYTPTLQSAGKYRSQRGNPPEGVRAKIWEKTFNTACDRVYRLVLRQGRSVTEARRRMVQAREDGTARDSAVERLIEAGVLKEDFVDSNP